MSIVRTILAQFIEKLQTIVKSNDKAISAHAEQEKRLNTKMQKYYRGKLMLMPYYESAIKAASEYRYTDDSVGTSPQHALQALSWIPSKRRERINIFSIHGAREKPTAEKSTKKKASYEVQG